MWRDKVAGPTLRSYDAACDELGGAPWRQLPEATDRWFLVDRPKSLAGRNASTSPPPTMETTGSFDLRRRLSDSTKLALLVGAALLAIVVVVFALAQGSTRVAAAAAPIVTTPAPVATPVVAPVAATVVAPTVKPARGPVAAKRHFAHRRHR
ncbi:MAG: hypothetical protein ACXVCV_10165 [Polyangia bacterium]